MNGTFLNFLVQSQTDGELIFESILDYGLNIFLPMFATFIFAWIIGFERQNVGKSAGISAHVLVAVASCAVAVMQKNLFFIELTEGKANPDGQRVIAQVITGVGFLGAGVILKSNRSVRGLTTAATIWSSAVLGLILGMGYWSLGLTLGFFIVIFMYSRDLIRRFNPFKVYKRTPSNRESDDTFPKE